MQLSAVWGNLYILITSVITKIMFYFCDNNQKMKNGTSKKRLSLEKL